MNNKSSYYKYNSSILILFISLLFSSTIKAQAEENSAENEHIEPTEIRITGALTPLGLDRIGKPVSIFTHQELQERSEPTIGELLATDPGVSSSYFGPGASRPIIRGQSKERVRILENGLESGDVSKVSDDHAVSIDPLTIQRVDVLRGPSTLLYGGSAIGGVVNMIDESIAEENIGRAITGEMDLRKGNSADDELSGALSLSGQQNTINWHFSGFYRETDDIKIPRFPESKRLRQGEAPNNHGHHHILKHDHDHEHHEDEHDHHDEHEEAIRGKLPNSDTLSKGFKVSASHVWDRGFLGLALRINSSRYGVPGGHSHGEDDDEHDHHHNLQKGQQHLRSGSHGHDDEIRIDLDQIRLESRGEVRLDDDFFKRIRFGMAYSDYRHKELEGDEVGTKFENNTFEGRVEVMHKHADDFEGGFGTQINY